MMGYGRIQPGTVRQRAAGWPCCPLYFRRVPASVDAVILPLPALLHDVMKMRPELQIVLRSRSMIAVGLIEISGRSVSLHRASGKTAKRKRRGGAVKLLCPPLQHTQLGAPGRHQRN